PAAFTQRSIPQVVVFVTPPVVSRLNILLSPAVNVTVLVNVANPPQHATGNAVNGNCGPNVANTPVTRFLLTGVTLVNGIARSGTPSPFVSHVTTRAFVTVFPARCSGIPV